MLKDPYSEVQEQAAEALENIGAAEAVPHLIPLLNDPDKSARAQAAGALGKIGAEAVPHLIPLLKDPEWFVRGRAAGALGKIGAEAVPHLIPLLKDPYSEVREQAAGALGNTSVKLDNSNDVQSIAGELLWCLTDVKEVAKSAFISLMNTANHLSVLEVNSLKLVDPVSNLAPETKMKKALRWIRLSMAKRKSPIMAMKFPQVYLRLFHFAALAE